jgi:ABC-type nitrate/sulfonate/bicarbonate transport system ATPase subunit
MKVEIDVGVSNIDVNFSDKIQALKNISFDVSQSEILCIVGPTGCGKSTLLRVILGFLPSTIGQVNLNTNRLQKNGIAYIPQSSALLPWRTLWQNAALGTEIKLNGMIQSEQIEFIGNLIREYGLEGFENQLPKELSGGMQRRTDIVQALASKPKLLLCDEVFSAIDFVKRLKLNGAFRHFCKQLGTTVILVTHDIEEAIFLGDRVAVMSSLPGRIIRIYDTQLSVDSDDPVRSRQSPEFKDLFNSIWQDLQENYEKTN